MLKPLSSNQSNPPKKDEPDGHEQLLKSSCTGARWHAWGPCFYLPSASNYNRKLCEEAAGGSTWPSKADGVTGFNVPQNGNFAIPGAPKQEECSPRGVMIQRHTLLWRTPSFNRHHFLRHVVPLNHTHAGNCTRIALGLWLPPMLEWPHGIQLVWRIIQIILPPAHLNYLSAGAASPGAK